MQVTFESEKKTNLAPAGAVAQVPDIAIQELEINRGSRLRAVIPAYHQHLASSTSSLHTRTRYRFNIEKFVEYLSNQKIERPVGDITHREIDKYVCFLKEDKKYAPKTVELAVTSLKSFFRWAHEKAKITSKNPTVDLPYEKAYQKIPGILTLAGYEAVLDLARTQPIIFCMIQLFVEGGLKKEELLLVRLRDFDVADKTRIALTAMNDDKRKIRRVVLPASFLEPFNAFVSERKSKDAKFNDHTPLYDYDPAYINKLLKSFFKMNEDKLSKYELSKSVLPGQLTPNNLRHFGARKYLENHSLEDLRKHLGLAPWELSPDTYLMYKKLKDFNI